MTQKKALKVRLYPSLKQEGQINQTIGNCRFWFNKCLDAVVAWKKEHGNYKGFKNPNPKEFKKELEWLSLGSSRALQQAQRDLDVAFRNMKKMGSGFPKFKKKGLKESYREPQVTGQIQVTGTKLKLLKLGLVNFRASDSYVEKLQDAKIINVTVSKNKVGHYFASVLCELEDPKKERRENSVGIDLGLKEFLVTSDEEVIKNPHFLRENEKKIKKLQKQLSRKTKGSHRYELQKTKLAKAHLQVANQRNHFLHELSSRLVSENQVICLEDLNVKGMVKNHKLAKAIHDVSWSAFVNQLTYKANWYGRDIVRIDRFFPSSKTCSCCGWINEDLQLSDRTFFCRRCGLDLDRDLNASKNILSQGMAEFAKTDLVKTKSTFMDKMVPVRIYRLKPEFLRNRLDEVKTCSVG